VDIEQYSSQPTTLYMYMCIFNMSDGHLPFSIMCANCWFSTQHFHSMCQHMESYEREAHHARCGCCYDVFNCTEALERHLFNGPVSTFDRHHITIFELMQASLLFNYHKVISTWLVCYNHTTVCICHRLMVFLLHIFSKIKTCTMY